MRRFLLAVFFYLLQLAHHITNGTQDYCENEGFDVSCQEHHVIVMRSALYGRMSVGKCAPQDFGYIGCQTNVLNTMDRKCSGRRSCSIASFAKMFPGPTRCAKGLERFLRAEYDCIPVASVSQINCRQKKPIEITDKHGYIANIMKVETGCGGSDAPLVIKGEAGQTINLTLFDFAVDMPQEASTFQSETRSMHNCPTSPYAIVKEPNTGETNICGGKRRVEPVYLSTSNVLEVQIITDDRKFFLFEYDVRGCSDPDYPANAWMKRDGDKAEFGCLNSDQSWEMHCEDTRWSGHMENCTVEPAAWLNNTGMSVPNSLLLIIIICTGCLVGLCICCVGVIIVKRHQLSHPKPDGQIAMTANNKEDHFTVYVPYDPNLAASSNTVGTLSRGTMRGNGTLSRLNTIDKRNYPYFQPNTLARINGCTLTRNNSIDRESHQYFELEPQTNTNQLHQETHIEEEDLSHLPPPPPDMLRPDA